MGRRSVACLCQLVPGVVAGVMQGLGAGKLMGHTFYASMHFFSVSVVTGVRSHMHCIRLRMKVSWRLA